MSGVLHVLLHMIGADKAVTSGTLAMVMATNPVVVRRVMAGLRDAGFVRSAKGHGGGWTIACDPGQTTLGDIYKALGSPPTFAMGHRTESPSCIVELAVNAALEDAFREAKAVLLARLGEVTLSTLVVDFGHRKKARRSGGETHTHAV